jgi:hypothetical protein
MLLNYQHKAACFIESICGIKLCVHQTQSLHFPLASHAALFSGNRGEKFVVHSINLINLHANTFSLSLDLITVTKRAGESERGFKGNGFNTRSLSNDKVSAHSYKLAAASAAEMRVSCL